MKKKIFLVKNMKYNFECIREEDDYLSVDEHVIISGVVEVDFPELDNKTVIDSQVEIIDKQIDKVNADAQAALTALEGRKQKLLALTN